MRKMDTVAGVLNPRMAEYVSLARVARLATVDARGRPYVVPVCFAWDDGRAFIALDDKPKSVQPTRLKRVRNIIANPHVSLLIDTYYEDWSRLVYVMIGGEARLLAQETEEHGRAVRLLRDKYPQYREMRIDEQPVISITATSAHTWSGSREEGEDAGPREWDFASLARGRHVVRQYKAVPVPRELVEMTIEAARWAPSPHGAQPWRFVVITRDVVKEKLAEAMSEEWERNLEMDGQETEVVMERLRKSRQRIAKSPVAIIACLYLEDLHAYPDPGRQEAEVTMAVQSIGAAIQNMLLSAYSLGLDTGWMCAPLFCPSVVQEALGLPETLIPHALINMGYGAKDPPRRPHRPVSGLIVYYD